ncbi:hypothetical protein M9H77_28677 [Catharanthus roseus]|uniref:Uncharacterized protein n=1 Tax=Catharanthus roseus TaxID=4058 RepID=A0ACC0AGZ3_CATRO|nr:hypothetical protein M9H77_28677 [Catharanthus roseus]
MGRNSGKSSLVSIVNPDAPLTPFPFNNAFLGFIYEFILNWKNMVGDGNCGFRVVSNFLFRDENHWVEIRRKMCFDLHHRMNVYVQMFGSVERVTELIRRTNWEEGSASADYWMDTPDHLYVIANTFNLCVVFLARLGSTTVLPLVSNIDGNAGAIFIEFIEEQQHFIQFRLLIRSMAEPMEVCVKAAAGCPDVLGNHDEKWKRNGSYLQFFSEILTQRERWQVIKFDEKWIPDSDVIVGILEEKYPEPSLAAPLAAPAEVLSMLLFLKVNNFVNEGANSKDPNDGSEHPKSHGPYVNGEDICAVDLSLAPKLHHLVVVSWPVQGLENS